VKTTSAMSHTENTTIYLLANDNNSKKPAAGSIINN